MPISFKSSTGLHERVLQGLVGLEKPSRVDAATVFSGPATALLADAIARDDSVAVAILATEGPIFSSRADLASRGDHGITLLQWAIFHGSFAAMKALLDAGADVLQAGMDGDTVIHTAAKADSPRYLEALLAHSADQRETANVAHAVNGAGPLVSALMTEREPQFRMLLQAGADPNRADRLGNTPLHVAGQINEPARALDLLRAGADPIARNRQQVTFQRYLFMSRDALLNSETRREREAVRTWLREHDVLLEADR